MKSKLLYQPTQAENGLWEFQTALGLSDNILTRADALRQAANTERADRTLAASKIDSPLATAIRKGLAAVEEVAS